MRSAALTGRTAKLISLSVPETQIEDGAVGAQEIQRAAGRAGCGVGKDEFRAIAPSVTRNGKSNSDGGGLSDSTAGVVVVIRKFSGPGLVLYRARRPTTEIPDVVFVQIRRIPLQSGKPENISFRNFAF